RLIAVTRHDDDVFVRKMLAAGAVGYVLKQSAGSELVRAVREIAKGHSYIDSSVKTPGSVVTETGPIDGPPVANGQPLTTDEEQVLRLIADSWSGQRIPEHLAIEVNDMLALRASAMQKAGLTTRIQLSHYARARGWLDTTRRAD